MENPRIVFMGTPAFGAGILQELIDEKLNIVAVVCQPDKLVGRKQVLTYPEVKKLALEHNIDVLQPVKIKTDYEQLLAYKPDLIVTCAYGQLIGDEVLNCAPLGCINIHPSLLPKLRGGAPLQHAILDGLTVTGTTIQKMVKKMDAGDILAQREYVIKEGETYGSLSDSLLEMSKELLRETLPLIFNNECVCVKQKEEDATFGYNISKEEEKVDFSKSYKEVSCRIRGLIPDPCAYGLLDGKKVKFWDISESDLTADKENGTVVFVGKGLGIVVDKRIFIVNSLQLEGKNKMSAREVRNGQGRNWEGKVFA